MHMDIQRRSCCKRSIRHAGGYALKVLLGLVIIFPVVVCLLYAFKSPAELMSADGMGLLIKNPTIENFLWVMDSIPIGKYLLNTLIQCAIVIVCQVILCSFAAYALVFFDFRLKKALFAMIRRAPLRGDLSQSAAQPLKGLRAQLRHTLAVFIPAEGGGGYRRVQQYGLLFPDRPAAVRSVSGIPGHL